MARKRVVILFLGRTYATGEVRRVESWEKVFSAAGAEVVRVPLLQQYRTRLARPNDMSSVAFGRAVPESLAWMRTAVVDRMRDLMPSVCICVTSRAFSPILEGLCTTVVLDYVDVLSQSYRQRASLCTSLASKVAFRVLSAVHGRFERQERKTSVRYVAAGYADAVQLGAEWVPNVCEVLDPLLPVRDEFDLIFVGNLSYLPNIAAVRRLAEIQRKLDSLGSRPSILLAGRHPTREVRNIARSLGWELVADFGDIKTVARRAKLAVFPIDHATGIQNKVLDMAMLGVPQVVTPEMLKGLDPGFLLSQASTDEEFVMEIRALLKDRKRRIRQARSARDHVEREYSVSRWASWGTDLLRTVG